ncbi:MAG TPA: hypothetical protein VKG38_14870 [Solirubrobacteraceae bacterium]|nr:hypothetical protein [Solirubrobacteraceae bacterium]
MRELRRRAAAPVSIALAGASIARRPRAAGEGLGARSCGHAPAHIGFLNTNTSNVRSGALSRGP